MENGIQVEELLNNLSFLEEKNKDLLSVIATLSNKLGTLESEKIFSDILLQKSTDHIDRLTKENEELKKKLNNTKDE